MHFVTTGPSIFYGQHQTAPKAFDNKRNNRVDSKWQMKEREENQQQKGEERGRRCSTGSWLILMAHGTNTCMLFIGETHICYFRISTTAGAWFFNLAICLVSPQKKRVRGFVLLRTMYFYIKMSSITPGLYIFFFLLNASLLLWISSSLIKSYLQAKGGCSEGNQYATHCCMLLRPCF